MARTTDVATVPEEAAGRKGHGAGLWGAPWGLGQDAGNGRVVEAHRVKS